MLSIHAVIRKQNRSESEQVLQYGSETAFPPSVVVNSENTKQKNPTAGGGESRQTHISTGVTAFLMFP